ncbi:MAG: (2Fe-2S)-binding protein [Verrucomicrobiae bacterium]|nr:(2Fe-2S)-binding protein [Verrucomicrobiae bacterium]
MSESAPSPNMIRLTVDGQPVTAPKGANAIQAARAAGVHIPHYCWHEKLSVSGNCRMCLVEIGLPRLDPDRKPILDASGAPEISWMPRPQIACATPVTEGMAIRTESELVRNCRRGVMEFLLLNHPLDCPICDQAGECHLQQYSVEYGAGRSRFVEEKERKPKRVRLGPRVTLDDERCILCSRCIRFCQEIAKDDVLGFFERGGYTRLGCYPGHELENNYSLNTVDLCPVGALTSTDFRFKMRLWFLKETDSVCSSCARGCNIIVGAREGVISRFTPRRNDAVNSEWMCDAGRLNYRWVHDTRRLTEPIRRESGMARAASWDEALRACREGLAAAQGRVAILASARLATEELFLIRHLAKALECDLLDVLPREGAADRLLVMADRNPNTAGARLTGVAAAPPGGRLAALREAVKQGKVEALLAVGECAVQAGIPEEALARLKLFAAVDILPSRSTELAHWIFPGAAHLEKYGTFVSGQGRMQRFAPAFPPKGGARPEREILAAFLPEKEREAFATFDAVFAEMCAEIPEFSGVTWKRLGTQGLPVAGEMKP